MPQSFYGVYRNMRRKNRSQYFFMFLMFFVSVTLITSYGIVMQSPTILEVLPEGGDSRKMLYMIFSITLLGCLLFIHYASGLFFRFKSREYGVFMALGASRKKLRRLLFEDLCYLSFGASAFGLLMGVPLATGLWNFFRFAVINTDEMVFSVSWSGLLYGIGFAFLSIVLVFVKGSLFIRRTDILEIINEQRKSEPVKEIKPWYGWFGIVLMVLGAFLGYYHVAFFFHILKMWPPAWGNALYLLVPAGLYLFLLYTVIHGWAPKSLYRNIVAKSIMKFQGRQTVRNMCIIALLTAGGLFAMFYTPVTSAGGLYTISQRPYEYAFHYRSDENMITEKEIQAAAEKYRVPISSYTEITSGTVGADGYREIYEDSGNISEEYAEVLSECQIVSAGDYQNLTGKSLNPAPGEFYFLGSPGDSDSSVAITRLTNPVTQAVLSVKLKESVPERSILLNSLVLNDADYEKITRGLTASWKEQIVCFHGENESEEAYDFSRYLFGQIVSRSSDECAVSFAYDRISKAYYESVGEPYGDDPLYYVSYENPDSISFVNTWKYMPQFSPMDTKDSLKNMSVFLMTFIFIFFICLMSILVILYTRSITLGLSCKMVYEDLKRLGASRSYLRNSVKKQLSTVFLSPTLVGAVGIWCFFLMILYANSGSITVSEWIGAGICFLLILVLGFLLYLFYLWTRKKVYRILDI